MQKAKESERRGGEKILIHITAIDSRATFLGKKIMQEVNRGKYLRIIFLYFFFFRSCYYFIILSFSVPIPGEERAWPTSKQIIRIFLFFLYGVFPLFSVGVRTRLRM